MDRRAWAALLLAVCALAVFALVGCAGASGADAPLAFVGADRQVYLMSVRDSEPRRVSDTSLAAPAGSEGVTYEWPTWSADGRSLAYLRQHRDAAGNGNFAVLVARADGGNARVIYENASQTSESEPFYLNWAPDASMLIAGAQGRQTVHVLLLDPTGSNGPRTITIASPVFYAWSPDSDSLLVHPFGDARVNPLAEVALFHLGREWDDRFILPARPVSFRVPGWSPDGTRVVVASNNDGQRTQLLMFDTRSGGVTPLLDVSDHLAFAWSPDGSRLAIAQRASDRVPTYNAIDILSLDDGVRTQVAVGDLASFFWSPEGDRIAYAVIQARENPGIAWWVVDTNGENRIHLGTYIPDDRSFFVLTFFDQYAQSMSPWSPDGSQFTFSGSLQGDPDERNRVFVVPTDGSAPPRALAEGQMSAWPPSLRR